MIDRILALFSGRTPLTPLPPQDAAHALGALMVRAAKADHTYLFEEVEQIDLILAHMHGLNKVAAARMRARCEKLDDAMPDTDNLARTLHDAIPAEAREAAVAALWQVVFADGIEHEQEDEFLHQVETVLGVAPDVALRLHDAAMVAAPQRKTE